MNFCCQRKVQGVFISVITLILPQSRRETNLQVSYRKLENCRNLETKTSNYKIHVFIPSPKYTSQSNFFFSSKHVVQIYPDLFSPREHSQKLLPPGKQFSRSNPTFFNDSMLDEAFCLLVFF